MTAYDVLGVAAHLDDLEAVMGGTAAKLALRDRMIQDTVDARLQVARARFG